ncbi:MAG TPA: cytochrome c maturation protein CcmE, partial [Gammaproteobacteria bacterium]|nr:cytochrome c maturation protein CcmE [Gammaproteobacteria bacterium]
MTRRRKRLFLVVFLLAGIGIATALSLVAFRKNMMYFYSPSQVAGGAAAAASQFRLGGLVK